MAHLDGTVDSYFERSQAEDVVSRVNGVLDVKNHLDVSDSYAPYPYSPYLGDFWSPYGFETYGYDPGRTQMSDSVIKEEIQDELWWSPFVDRDDVHVTVEDGVATLTGFVDSRSEYHAATENAYEGGAIWVDNDLVIAN